MSAKSSSSGKVISVSLDKEHYRRLLIEPDVMVCHLYPTLAAWVGRQVSDDVNPRSHEEQAMKGGIPDAIEETIRDHPRDFYLANRGETILAEAISYDPDKQIVEIVLTNWQGDDAQHGVADGGTTDAVIARVQREVAMDCEAEFGCLSPDQIPDFLREARVHLEVIVGLDDKDRIRSLVQGRNTSRQVKSWTIGDFKGNFDWIKDLLEANGSPFKGKVGYEENSGKPINILEVIAILTLFHPMYNAKGGAPTVAYSSKGRMDKRLVDSATAPGYRLLESILLDILTLHDHVHAHFHDKYREAFPGGKLGRRGKTEDRICPRMPRNLPLTGARSEYLIPSGVLYPLLASLRALVRFPNEGGSSKKTGWKIDPIEFFDKNGAELMENLISQLEAFQNNPQTLGKTKTVYTALHDRAWRLVTEMEADTN